jgi:hypothetical protein
MGDLSLAHRLKLVLEDVLQGTSFDDVNQVLLRLYYLGLGGFA